MADTPNKFVPLSRDNADYAANRHRVEGAIVPDARTDEERDADRRRQVIDLAMKRFKVVEEAERIQRAQELEDLQFDRGRKEDHWPAEILQHRGASADQKTPARPSLVINKFRVPIKQVVNEGRSSRLAIVVKPKPGKASEKDAEVRQGLLRAIEVDSDAMDARLWAYQRMVKCGRGYYRVEKTFANDGDFLVDLVVSRIKNQGSVYIDPFHTKPDGSDAEYYFVTEDLPREEYEQRFPEEKHGILKLNGDALSSVTDRAPMWLSAETVRIAEYFTVLHDPRWLVRTAEGVDLLLEAGAPKPVVGSDLPYTHCRKVDKRTIHWYLINAHEVIEDQAWDGRYIPIIQLVGEEFNVNGQSSYGGMITDGKDAQRLYNYAVSMEAEGVALAPRAPFIAAYGQIEPYMAMWESANVRNWAALPYKPVEVNGHLVPPPQRNVVEPAIQAIAMLVAQADADLKGVTGRYDPSLGNISPTERSGKALREMKQQAEMGSSNYLDSLATGIRHEAKILLDLLKYVYVEPGRIARMVGDEPGDERSVMLNADFVRAKDGTPQRPPSAPVQFLQELKGKVTRTAPPAVEHYDITKGDYMVVVDVGPSFKTQREENVSLMQSLYEASPDLAPLTIDLMAEELGGPFGRKLAERVRAMNPNLPKDDQADIPPEAQAVIGQLTQQMEQMGQALQQAQQALATDQAKQQAQVQIAQMEQATKTRLEEMKLMADIALQRAKLESDEQRARFDAAMEKALQDDQQAHERYMAMLQHAQTVQAAARTEGAAARGDLRKAALADHADDRKESASARADVRQATLAERAAEAADRRAQEADRETDD